MRRKCEWHLDWQSASPQDLANDLTCIGVNKLKRSDSAVRKLYANGGQAMLQRTNSDGGAEVEMARPIQVG